MAVLFLVGALVPASPAAADDLGSARLLVAGTRLTVTPESQTVPFNTPTVVETHLEGYDPAQGVLPDDLRVLADLTGPEIDGILVLETRPNQPFRIPRLALKGEYVLDDIRLVQGDELLGYAEPRSAAVLVTQVLVTRVTSRALTLDEIRHYGIVVDEDNFRAFNFTFGFAVDGEVYDYNIPVVQSATFGEGYQVLIEGAPVFGRGSEGTGAPRFRPPQMAPFTLTLPPRGSGPIDNSTGGCENPFGCTDGGGPISLPGVILFPTDVSLLNQYFSVVLVAKNDAPAGDRLVIRDLTAKVGLPPGLRMAETEPPTPLGVPVPVRVPGLDGRLGTGDDLTFLIAQSSGEAEVLVEGRKEGTHVVTFDLEGVLEGLPGGRIERVTGQARGAVVVRDPTLGVTLAHPAVVRAGEEYSLRLTVANTSNAPVNLVTVALPASKLSGVQVVGSSEKTIPTLPPGESEVLEFRLQPTRTGKVVASSVRSPYQVAPRFELTVGVGENGIPLSPDSIVLPESTEELPPQLVSDALALVGLGFSLATAPASALDATLPRMDLSQVDEKVYWLSQAGRHVRLGEDTFDAVASLAAEWTGARPLPDWEWDRLRRTTDKGGRLGDSIAEVLAAEAAATSPRSAFERFAATTAYLGALQGALAVGSGARLEVSSRTSGLRLAGGGLAPDRRRDLPFADLYDLDGAAQVALVAQPEEGGYQVRLTDSDGGSTDLQLLLPDPDGGTLRTVRWTGVSLGSGGLAVADFAPADLLFTLYVDADGDGLVDQQLAGVESTLSRRPFTALAAVQRADHAGGHVIEVLFSQDVDLSALVPTDPQRFSLPGNVSNGGLVPAEADLAAFNWLIAENKFSGLRNTRVVQVSFSNPVSPYVEHQLTVRDVASNGGDVVAQDVLPLVTTVSDPGGVVEGRVIGSDGSPIPFARVDLFEADVVWQTGECIRHRTAATRTDANGAFRFDYVRSNTCGDVFVLRAVDPQTGRGGEGMGRVRLAGGTQSLDVVLLGRGTIRGRVTYDDGSVPADPRVVAYSPVFAEGIEATVYSDGTYEAREVPVGTITLGGGDRQGSFVYQTVEIPSAGAVVERDLVILRRSSQAATGDVRGTVTRPDGTTPVFNAYLALYVDGELVGVERSAFDGTFDFGTVPAGVAEIEGFDGETGLGGVHVTFQVQPDQVNQLELRLQDERGTVEGTVYRRTAHGNVPLAGAVVWASGTPFNTVTDANGHYRLDGVFAGERNIEAADLSTQELTRGTVTVTEGATAYRDLFFIEEFGEGGLVGEVLGFTGNPVPGALVHLGDSNDQRWWREAVTDTRGRFTMPDLRPGTYVVNAVSGISGARETVTIQYQGQTPFVSLRFKKGTIRGRTVAENESGQTVGVTSLVTYRTTTVNEGMVGLSWTPTTLETDADGWFEIPDVLVGRYVLSVTNAFHGDQTLSGELVFHGEEAEHLISFQRNGSIRGTVYDWDGETPVAGAVVHLRHPNFSDYDLVTDAEGRFAFELVPPGGRFAIDVEHDGGALFRRGQVWVNYTRHGQELDVALSLPKQGTVSGWVEDAGGIGVPGAVVTLREHAYPRRSLVQTADGEGFFSFTNVFAGRVSIDAQAPALGGLGGRTTNLITTEGEEVWSLVTLEGTGEIAGRVISPVDGQPVPSAQVTLYKWGGSVVDAVTADDTGAFRFRLLPLGLYRIWVFDPRTGRHGALDAVPIDFNGQVSGGDVSLEVRGEVEGHLYDPGSGATIPGATIRLQTDSLVDFTTFSSADSDGYYEFLGIPEGTFVLRADEPEGRRQATAEGVISEEGERVTVDLFLEATGRVVGTVLNPPGAPAGPFPNANTVIRENGRVVGATFDNPFAFDGLIVGKRLTVESYEVGGDHRGVATGILSAEGQELTVDVTMQPIGTVVVAVSDSFGNPVAGADLRLTSTGFYGRRRLTGSTGPDGRATFSEVGVGHVGGYVVNPINSLRGSAAGQLTLDGQVLEIAFQLEDAASLRGRLLLADGLTPAEDALVVVTVAGRTYQLRADATGDFELPSLPLGNFTLVAQEYFGLGYLEHRGSFSTNGEAQDLGTLVLDDADPELLAHVPLSGARDLPLSSTVVLHFSEPLDRSRFSSSWFQFRRLSGGNVGYSVAWSDGDATATLTPTAPLANFTGYEVIVNDAYDLAGRRLKERIKTVFYTVDQVAPTVVDVLPRNGQVQVPVDTDLRLTFSEPVVLESLSGTALQLTDLSSGQGITTTFQLLPGERQVLVTPQQLLLTDRTYQLTVQGVRDGSGNTMAAVVSTTFKTPDTLPPTIDSVDFPAGTSFTSGDDVPVSVTAGDPSGVGKVVVHVGDWSFSDTAAPWELTALAPVVGAPTDQVLVVEVRDVYGNAAFAERTIQVSPRINGTAPIVSTSCAQDGDHVVPGFAVEIQFTASDDEAVESYRFLVDSVELDYHGPANQPEVARTFQWQPPQAPPGTTFVARLEARDFAGNVSARELTFLVPMGTILTAGQSVFAAAVEGEPLTLAGGTYPVQEALVLPSLTILRGATLTGPAAGAPVHLDVSGEIQVQCGALIDLGGKGFAGGSFGHPAGYGPAGPSPSLPDAGGSHGGAGIVAGGAGPAGEVYGSVQWPRSPGAGGAYDGNRGRAGGGAVRLRATTLKLEGEIRSHGSWGCEGGAGAGGSILVEAGTVRGSGKIRAHGSGSCSTSGAGGGGRIALHAGALDGFDPWNQASTLGGERQYNTFASAGTVLVRTPQYPVGWLQISNGLKDDDYRVAAFTELAALGTGNVAGFAPAAADAWVHAAAPLQERWLGAWMVLSDASGSELGSFEVVELDSSGGVRLAGAGSVVGASDFRGEYRFDRIDLGPGAGLRASDPVRVSDARISGGRGLEGPFQTDQLVFGAGSSHLAGSVEALEVTVEAGATVIPVGASLDLSVVGTLTIESGGRITAAGRGYTGGQAPPGLVRSTGSYNGGSHGGLGMGSSPGETFDSVYEPRLAGGGGAPGRWSGAPGGGIVSISAGELVLDGVIDTLGSSWCGGGGGGGGSILLDVGTFRGAGEVRAWGGNESDCYYPGLPGGGGRIAVRAQVMEGIDPSTQLQAWGGLDIGHDYAGPGTVYYRTASQTYGTLLVGNGHLDDGTVRTPVTATPLPELPAGAVSEAVSEGADLRLTGNQPFLARSVGTWIVLLDSSEEELGAFVVAEVDAQGRVLLEGAATASAATTFRSEYRFDRVEIHTGARLSSVTTLIAGELVVEDGGQLSGDTKIETLVFESGPTIVGGVLNAENLTLRSGAIVGSQGQHLDIQVNGTLTVEAGARIHADGKGYSQSQAPDGIAVSTGSYNGGSHGGLGMGSSPGETFDSVYEPRLAGGGGAPGRWSGAPGGGIISISASELVLDGTIDAIGSSWCGGGGGGGGSIVLDVGTFRGGGAVRAWGGSENDCYYPGLPGGGGRIAVHAQVMDGIVPSSQLQAWGGLDVGHDYAGPGTVFYRTASQTYGSLLVDNGRHDDGTLREPVTATPLPELPAGAVAEMVVEGSDLRLTGPDPFQARSMGTWIVLLDASQGELGAFPVTEVDSQGRVLLAGAASAAAAVSFRSEYRFDRVEIRSGATLSSESPLFAGELVVEDGGELAGDTRVDTLVFESGITDVGGVLEAENLTLRGGAVLRAAGERLDIQVNGTLTVEAGARLHANGKGYSQSQAPAGVTPSTGTSSGGSHGGRGLGTGSGDPFDSLAWPNLSGGGGAVSKFSGAPGGGVVTILAGELVLDGDIEAVGSTWCGGGGGAGGSVLVEVGAIRGSGFVRATGGNGSSGCYYHALPGAGGRVALHAQDASGFSPQTQLQAWGGEKGSQSDFGSPGTVFFKLAEHQNGVLVLDNGELPDGTNRESSVTSDLPELIAGSVASTEAAEGDLWISGSAPFLRRWLGAWMVLEDGAGVELGGFRAVELGADGRLRLAGAGGVTGAATYRGEYRFDRIEVRNGSRLSSASPLILDDLIVDDGGYLAGAKEFVSLDLRSGKLTFQGELIVQDLLMRSGTILAPDGSRLDVRVLGTATLEAGSRLHANGLGYSASQAPAGVVPSSSGGSGGSHGGTGAGTAAGEIYDSVYLADLAGGGGANGKFTGSPGGGAIHLVASELVLDGTIESLGSVWCSGGAGAGGTVRLEVGTLRGSGLVRADGADGNTGCLYDYYPGGGGRIAVSVDALAELDPLAAFQALGGGKSGKSPFAAPGTVYYRLPGQIHGVLLVDQRRTSGTPPPATRLPSIGRGTVAAVTDDGSNAWIEPQDPSALFDLGVRGMWLRIGEVDYPVLDQSPDRRLLLVEGAAGAVSIGDAFVGIYKFDEVHVRGLAALVVDDGLEAPVVAVAAGSSISRLDVTKPEVAVTAPAAGSLYPSGDPVAISAEVVDASAITSVVFRLGEQSFTDDAAPWEATLPAPVVAVEEDVDLVVEAADAEGNVGTATRTIRVRPLAPGDPPQVSVACPSPGGLVAPGTSLPVTIVATHDDGIEKVDFRLGDDPTVVGTLTVPPYTFPLQAPAGAVEGDLVVLKAQARSFSGTTAAVEYTAKVVEGAVVSTDTMLAAGDLSLDGASVFVVAGTLTLEGAHSFRDLVVLDGATVTHPPANSAGQQALDLAVTRDVFLSCGGAIDVSGRGWPGGFDLPEDGGDALYFADDFSGDLSQWQSHDYTTYSGPSDWRIDGADFLRQDSNIHIPNSNPDWLATHIYWTGGLALTDYRVSARLRSQDDDPIGVMMRYQDPDNYYRFIWDLTSNRKILDRRVNGVRTILAEVPGGYTRYAWHEVELVADGSRLEVWVDGQKAMSATDTLLSSGSVGFSLVGNAGSYFDDLVVRAVTSTSAGAGGSHGGRGGSFDGSGRIYGTPFDPWDAGAGGGGRTGGAGGGVVRLVAGGSILVDGAVSASAAVPAGTSPLGAGGAILLQAPSVAGLGTIEASGGGDGTARAAGGGGRIALYGAAIDPGLLSRTTAAGGAASSATLTGAAGTVFVKRDAQPLGDLFVDNLGRTSDQLTALLAPAASIVEVVHVDGFTDSTASFPYSLVGAEVALNGDLSTLWSVQDHADGGDTLTLDVAAPPWTAVPGDGYELVYRFDRVVVRGGAKVLTQATVASSTAPEVEVGSAWTAGYEPTLELTAPLEGAVLVSGDLVTFTAVIQDDFGSDFVELELDGAIYRDDSAPYEWALSVPFVTTPTLQTATVRTVDRGGHRLQDTVSFTVTTSADANTPVVSLADCPADGDIVATGIPLGLPFTATDLEKIHLWRVKVDGVVVEEVSGVDSSSIDGTIDWIPPTDVPGTSYLVELEVQDYGGNVAVAQRTVRLPSGLVLTGSQSLDPSVFQGAAVVLAGGTFQASGALDLASLRLLSGAVLVGPSGTPLEVHVADQLVVQCGATLDMRSRGYAGGTYSSKWGKAPAGVTGSSPSSSGSHGGSGRPGYGGTPGEVYDSVYAPGLGGGGGSTYNSSSSYTGGRGGGVVALDVGTLVLDGEILVQGEQRRYDYREASGAGGTVRVRATEISGLGRIDASGADSSYCGSGDEVGAGGGGRVALVVDSFVGFDPETQVVAYGGQPWSCSTSAGFAAPGTVYLRDLSSTYGRLRIDAGESAPGVDQKGLVTQLPVLGTGSVVAVEIAGSDLWITAASTLPLRWLGTWMVLEDGTGTDLGGFEVVEMDGTGRVRLEGAAGVVGATSFRGEYRFDRVDLLNGAGLSVSDELVTAQVDAFGSVELSGPIVTPHLDVWPGDSPNLFLGADLRPDRMTLRSGIVATAVTGDTLYLQVPTLEIESGATLDMRSRGYAGGTYSSKWGKAPAGVPGSSPSSSGSHGGSGRAGYGGTPGEVYDSVYAPGLGGGGGSTYNSSSSYTGGRGGGVVALDVGTLVLDGEILVQGEQRRHDYREASGAGGTVRVRATEISGLGRIDASGADSSYCGSGDEVGAGGGGRVALVVDSFVGFDPETQVVAYGGQPWSCSTSAGFAAPGTVYLRDLSSTYGRLWIDAGESAPGVDRKGLVTQLPVLGTGSVAAVEIAGSDLWITAASALPLRWLGTWMVLEDGTGTDLGGFEVVEMDGSGRVRLEGAAGVVGATSFRGEYRFDRVDLLNGAGLAVSDELVTAQVDAFGSVDLSGPIVTPHLDVWPGDSPNLFLGADLRPDRMTLRSGIVATAVTGDTLYLQVPTLEIESGATLDMRSRGYAGGTYSSKSGKAPAGVPGSSPSSSGSHGGSGHPGYGGTPGEVYDSVYAPGLGGGGGSTYNSSSSYTGGRGGGVVALDVGTLVLNGEILVQGEQRRHDYREASGAGGTVRVRATEISGLGRIDASGADSSYCGSGDEVGAGGGGRVALVVDSFVGFDPETQVVAYGGQPWSCNASAGFAAPGTVYVRDLSSTYGRLRVETSPGHGALGATFAPTLGTGTVGVADLDPVIAADLWIEPQDPAAQFALGVTGAWLRIGGNDFRIVEQVDRRRVRLEGAAGFVAVGDAYQGVYKFDAVTVRNGAVLQFLDTAEIGTTDVDADSQLVLP